MNEQNKQDQDKNVLQWFEDCLKLIFKYVVVKVNVDLKIAVQSLLPKYETIVY